MQASSASCGDRVLARCPRPERPAWVRGAALVAIGVVSLGAGLAVYVIDRAAAHALVGSVASAHSGQPLFGAVGLWLPSFVHPLAFSLFSAALLGPWPRWQYGACGFWFAVNTAFEIGQHPQLRVPLADALRRGFGDGAVVRAAGNYFLRGTFDVADLVANAFGAALAALIVHRLHFRQEQGHGRTRLHS